VRGSQNGIINATIADYRAIYALANHHMQIRATFNVPDHHRQVVNAIASVTEHRTGFSSGVSQKTLAEKLDLDKGTMSRSLRKIEEGGFVRNARTKDASTDLWVVDQPLPEKRPILPTPDDLEREFAKSANLTSE
jgi:DNA-binding transcriptional regulator LsrR (DeoR family)